jgi:hypothetical protein
MRVEFGVELVEMSGRGGLSFQTGGFVVGGYSRQSKLPL